MWSGKVISDIAVLEDPETMDIAETEITHNDMLPLMDERAGIPIDLRMSDCGITHGPCNYDRIVHPAMPWHQGRQLGGHYRQYALASPGSRGQQTSGSGQADQRGIGHPY